LALLLNLSDYCQNQAQIKAVVYSIDKVDYVRFEPTTAAHACHLSFRCKAFVQIPPAPFFIARPKTRLSYFIENHVLLRNSM
jgi:hypothetical protein